MCAVKERVVEEKTACGCAGNQGQETGACGLSPREAPAAGNKEIVIELLYLDLEVCDPCRGAEASLEEAIAEVGQVLRATGTEVTLRKIHVESLEQAEALRFVSSPTIRVGGRDIQMEVQESHCHTCSELSGTDVDCRSWVYQGQTYSTPPKAMVIEAILRALYGGADEESTPHPYTVPENLQRFFAAKERSTAPTAVA